MHVSVSLTTAKCIHSINIKILESNYPVNSSWGKLSRVYLLISLERISVMP